MIFHISHDHKSRGVFSPALKNSLQDQGLCHMYCDTHIHTSFSFDSDADPRSVAEQAVKLGIPRICITDHQDYLYPADEQTWLIDTDRYFPELLALREEFEGRLQIDIGAEIGCQAEMDEEVMAFIEGHPFDFIIGSTHFAGGMDPYDREYFEGRSKSEAYKAFFERILENLRVIDDIDTLGHIDYVTRYGKEFPGEFNWKAYRDCFADIFTILIAKDICLEVNTAGYAAGLGRPNPGPELLRFYRELGGRLITLGSDAHEPGALARQFDITGMMLKELGFSEYMVFSKRIPQPYPL